MFARRRNLQALSVCLPQFIKQAVVDLISASPATVERLRDLAWQMYAPLAREAHPRVTLPGATSRHAAQSLQTILNQALALHELSRAGFPVLGVGRSPGIPVTLARAMGSPIGVMPVSRRLLRRMEDYPELVRRLAAEVEAFRRGTHRLVNPSGPLVEVGERLFGPNVKQWPVLFADQLSSGGTFARILHPRLGAGYPSLVRENALPFAVYRTPIATGVSEIRAPGFGNLLERLGGTDLPRLERAKMQSAWSHLLLPGPSATDIHFGFRAPRGRLMYTPLAPGEVLLHRWPHLRTLMPEFLNVFAEASQRPEFAQAARTLQDPRTNLGRLVPNIASYRSLYPTSSRPLDAVRRALRDLDVGSLRRLSQRDVWLGYRQLLKALVRSPIRFPVLRRL